MSALGGAGSQALAARCRDVAGWLHEGGCRLRPALEVAGRAELRPDDQQSALVPDEPPCRRECSGESEHLLGDDRLPVAQQLLRCDVPGPGRHGHACHHRCAGPCGGGAAQRPGARARRHHPGGHRLLAGGRRAARGGGGALDGLLRAGLMDALRRAAADGGGGARGLRPDGDARRRPLRALPAAPRRRRRARPAAGAAGGAAGHRGRRPGGARGGRQPRLRVVVRCPRELGACVDHRHQSIGGRRAREPQHAARRAAPPPAFRPRPPGARGPARGPLPHPAACGREVAHGGLDQAA
mmetsp:Transcript_162629/g.521408  ORF Transcript_162629/g.521408 Transcript_162629/m.521408 type:complete len:297 (+) Transcript_162629:1798-2688(+)